MGWVDTPSTLISCYITVSFVGCSSPIPQSILTVDKANYLCLVMLTCCATTHANCRQAEFSHSAPTCCTKKNSTSDQIWHSYQVYQKHCWSIYHFNLLEFQTCYNMIPFQLAKFQKIVHMFFCSYLMHTWKSVMFVRINIYIL
jgi:hypothetical protein